jgi:hypothetical protein
MSKRFTSLNDFSIPPLSIFLLRQAIEIKIGEMLNIGAIQTNDNKPVKVTTDKFISLLSEDNFVLPVKKSIIEKIDTWTNAYIHLGIVDYFWKVEFAQEILNPLFSLVPKPFAKESYYVNSLERDVKAIINGECKIIPLNNTPIWVELISDDDFIEVSRVGYEKYCREMQAKLMECLTKD